MKGGKLVTIHGRRLQLLRSYKPNGARECTRRRAQIERGALRLANGLERAKP